MILTIITINYNNAPGLQKTIESVLSQTSQDFEYIVVDGGAPQTAPQPPKGGVSDRAVIENFMKSVEGLENGFTHCTWLSSASGRRVGGGYYSESDNGIYHAMNKGIRMAKGEYIHFLNSGDWLVDEHVVEKMLGKLNELIEKGQQPDVFVGNKIMIRPDGKIRRGHNDKRPVTAFTFYRGTIEHTSAYIRRELFETVGLYDETLRIVSDWKWYFEAVLHHNAKVSYTDLYVTYFDNTGISSTNLQLDKAERRQVLEELLPEAVLADYDTYSFDIDQMQRLKRYPVLYRLVWFVERCLFKIDKCNGKYWGWRKLKK